MAHKHGAFLLHADSILVVTATNGQPGSPTCPFHKQQLFWWCKTSLSLWECLLSSLQLWG